MLISGDKVKRPSDALYGIVNGRKVRRDFEHKPREFHKIRCKLVVDRFRISV